jgi:hypothetical protein
VRNVPDPGHFGTDSDPDPTLLFCSSEDANKQYIFLKFLFPINYRKYIYIGLQR